MSVVHKNPPAKTEEVREFITSLGYAIPLDFVKIMGESNGMDVETADYDFTIWALGEILSLNKEYQVEEFATDFILLGTNGGGIVLAMEKMTAEFYAIPFIGFEKSDGQFLAKNFTEFLALE